jgi:hypothetical protein
MECMPDDQQACISHFPAKKYKKKDLKTGLTA